jgi:anti-anti-sigma regulatory factor/PAS domain-containing protein
MTMKNESGAVEDQNADNALPITAGRPTGSNEQDKPNGQSRSDSSIDPALLHFALSSVADGVCICDSHGRLVVFNDAATVMFGERRGDTEPTEWSEHYGIYDRKGGRLLAANELPLVRAMMGEKVEDFEFYTCSQRCPTGLSISSFARPLYDAEQRLLGAVVICRDITARKKAEEEQVLREQVETQRRTADLQAARKGHILQVLLDHLNLVVWVADEKGTFLFHDGKGSEVAGIPKGSLVGANLFELFPDFGGIRKALDGITTQESSVLGSTVWENWYVPLKNEETNQWNVIGMSLDVTEAQRAKVDLEAKLALIERQQSVINDLETPVIQVWDGVLTLPMVGVVDSRRAARVTEDLLRQVSGTRAQFAILDLTGVEVVDTATAGHLLNIASAVRLLGAEGIITGIRPNIAQTIIALGVDLTRVRTLATLRDGLAFAIRSLSQRESAKTLTKSSFQLPADR